MKFRYWTAAVAAVLAAIVTIDTQEVAALYQKGSSVKLLNNKNFQKVVYQSKDVVLVEFFAPWCGHCQRLAPAYKSAAKKLRDIAVVAAVNCDASENRELCGQHGVQGFPTIKLIYPLQDKKKPGQLKKTSIDYQGERSADALVEAVTNRLPTWAITGLTAGDSTIARANIDEFLTNQDKHKPLGLPEDLAKAIFFTDKPTVAPLIRSLGLTLHGKLRVGVSRDPEIAKRFKITKTPALLAFPAGATEADDAIRYEGQMKRSQLLEFLGSHVGTHVNDIRDKSHGSEKETSSETTVSVKQILSQDELDACVDADGYCFIALLDDDSDSMETELQVLNQLKAKVMQTDRQIQFGYLRGADGRMIASDLALSGSYPVAVIFHWTERTYQVYTGDTFDTEHLIQFIDEVVDLHEEGLPLQAKPQFAAGADVNEHDDGYEIETEVDDKSATDQILHEEL